MKRSVSITVGLTIAALLALADITLPFGGDGRPSPVAVAGLVLGVLTLVGVFLHWRGRRLGVPTVIVTRLLSAVITVPTLVMSDVGAADRLVAGLVLLLTVIAVVLLIGGLRQRAGMPAHTGSERTGIVAGRGSI